MKIAERDLKCLSSFFAAMGPMFGKPSRMNCNFSFFVREIFEGRIDWLDVFGFFAKTERYFAVSFSFRVKIIGTWYSKATASMKPLKAFSWIWPW